MHSHTLRRLKNSKLTAISPCTTAAISRSISRNRKTVEMWRIILAGQYPSLSPQEKVTRFELNGSNSTIRTGMDPGQIQRVISRPSLPDTTDRAGSIVSSMRFGVRSEDLSDRRIKRIARTPAGEEAVTRFQRELVRASSLAKLTPKARRGLLAALTDIQWRPLG